MRRPSFVCSSATASDNGSRGIGALGPGGTEPAGTPSATAANAVAQRTSGRACSVLRRGSCDAPIGGVDEDFLISDVNDVHDPAAEVLQVHLPDLASLSHLGSGNRLRNRDLRLYQETLAASNVPGFA
jgi:hypothetical protein